MRLIQIILAFFIGLLLANCAQEDLNKLPKNVEQSITSVLKRVSEEKGVVGYAVAILKDGQLVYRHAGGQANMELNVPADPTQVYQIYSITKLFVITTLYQLVEEGKVVLDAPIGTYLTDIPQHWQKITVRQILSHQSGLPEYFAAFRDMPLQADDLLSPLFDKPMNFEVGSRSQYNQTNYFLIGRIIEILTGKSLTMAINDRMINPYALKETTYGGSDVLIANRVSSYSINRSGGPLRPNEYPFFEYNYASAGLNTSLQDMGKWFALLLEGKLIPRQALYQSWQPLSYNDGSEANFVNGWESRSDGDIRIVGHIGGGRTNVRHYFNRKSPDSSVTILYFTNGTKFSYDMGAVSDELVGILSPDLIGPIGQLGQKLSKAIAGNDWPTLEDHYRAFRQNSEFQTFSTESIINRMGYQAVGQPATRALAVKIFEMNVRDYPESANVYDSLGDGYFAAEQYEKARDSYKKAYEMEPEIFTHVPQSLIDIASKLKHEQGKNQ